MKDLEFKGTEGEWLFAQSPKKGFDSIVYTQEAGVAGINTICLIPDDNSNNDVEKVIASARELLEALHLLRDKASKMLYDQYINTVDGSTHDEAFNYSKTHDWIIKANKAIEKALK